MLVAEESTTYREIATEMTWWEVMLKEFEAIKKKKKTRSLTNLLSNHKPINLKWVFNFKKDSEGNIIKHKVRVVVNMYV